MVQRNMSEEQQQSDSLADLAYLESEEGGEDPDPQRVAVLWPELFSNIGRFFW
jgi:hypothetical protein